MKAFPSTAAYWKFVCSVRSGRRHVLTTEARSFLRAISDSAAKRVDSVSAGDLLWRAQCGATTIEIPIDGSDDSVIEDYSYDAKRMKPLRDRAREGRANPKGIPFLYLASHRDTAAAEVRPWKDGVVSIGLFRVVRDLRIVNTTLDSKQRLYIGREPSSRKREEAVWGDIDHAFAVPTSLTDDTADYAPTQVLAEMFRDAGFEGIAYRSAYGEGHNLVLFDVDVATQVNCMLLRVKDLTYHFQLEEQFGYSL